MKSGQIKYNVMTNILNEKLLFCKSKCTLITLDDSHRTGTSEIAQQLKVFKHHSEAFFLTVFFNIV